MSKTLVIIQLILSFAIMVCLSYAIMRPPPQNQWACTSSEPRYSIRATPTGSTVKTRYVCMNWEWVG